MTEILNLKPQWDTQSLAMMHAKADDLKTVAIQENDLVFVLEVKDNQPGLAVFVRGPEQGPLAALLIQSFQSLFTILANPPQGGPHGRQPHRPN